MSQVEFDIRAGEGWIQGWFALRIIRETKFGGIHPEIATKNGAQKGPSRDEAHFMDLEQEPVRALLFLGREDRMHLFGVVCVIEPAGQDVAFRTRPIREPKRLRPEPVG